VQFPVVVAKLSNVPELAIPNTIPHNIPGIGGHIGVEDLSWWSSRTLIVAHGIPTGSCVIHVDVVELLIVRRSHFITL